MDYSEVVKNPGKFDFSIPCLGETKLNSPVKQREFVPDHTKISFPSDLQTIQKLIESDKPFPAFQKAGPREKTFHDPAWSRAAVLTAGGLCPGLNDVIKGLVETLWFSYGVKTIFGIRYGYRGLNPRFQYKPLMLDPDVVDTIHDQGGSILGSSRGEQSIDTMVDTLQRLNINLLFCIGGDGTLRGAAAISNEVSKRKLPISIVGIPKTIDNDLSFVGRTFGFESAVYACSDMITSAHMEAKGSFNGIGLVKLMGRDSGYIAAYASLSNSVVNFCLVPEMELNLEGENGLLKALERRLRLGKDHALIVVAEGAGQKFFQNMPEKKDASGNILKNDIGEYLNREIPKYLESVGLDCKMKYFDPSYLIRSVAAAGTDAIFCYQLAEHGVHAAMAGKTNMVVGKWNNEFTHVPIRLAVMERQKINLESSLWKSVLVATRQMDYFHP